MLWLRLCLLDSPDHAYNMLNALLFHLSSPNLSLCCCFLQLGYTDVGVPDVTEVRVLTNPLAHHFSWFHFFWWWYSFHFCNRFSSASVHRCIRTITTWACTDSSRRACRQWWRHRRQWCIRSLDKGRRRCIRVIPDNTRRHPKIRVRNPQGCRHHCIPGCEVSLVSVKESDRQFHETY